MKTTLTHLVCGFLACTPASAVVQYCAKNTQQGVDFCVSIASYRNDSTHGLDLYLTLGVLDRPGEGWMAVGIGELMAGSLMFVIATDENEQTIVSARTTRGHFSPEPSPELVPHSTVVSVNSATRGWRETSFTCYSCDNWAGLQLESVNHPWIWAYNGYQKNEHADESFGLQMHNSIGFFYVNMTGVEGNTSEPAGPPPLDRSTGSHGASSTPLTNEPTPKSSFSSARGWHGFLLCVAFMVLYPGGAVISILKRRNWFRMHVGMQILGSVACLVGVALQAWPLGRAGMWRRILDAHPFLGTLLVCLVLAQLALGHWHHVEFSRKDKKMAITSLHVWNGRLILVSGALNTFMGLMYAGASGTLKYFWGFFAVFEVVLFLVVLPRLNVSISKQTRADVTAMNQGIGDEAALQLLPTLKGEETDF
ncbi:hypothetical protein F4677DRAFT_464052 [Hypoxylon crocopeplum]|nr:hypothetical protein F4677DRAFT_464052 [Hypoxylon crocopeplum]